jgi:hypothetical protein
VEAIIGYLRAVGIRANLHYLQYAAYRDAVRAGKAPLAVWTWGSFSINDISAGVSVFHKFEADDTARDPEVRDLMERGDSVVDPQERKAAYTKALGLIAERAEVLPLYSIPTFYVARQGSGVRRLSGRGAAVLGDALEMTAKRSSRPSALASHARAREPGSMNTASIAARRSWSWVPGSRLRRAPERRRYGGSRLLGLSACSASR